MQGLATNNTLNTVLMVLGCLSVLSAGDAAPSPTAIPGLPEIQMPEIQASEFPKVATRSSSSLIRFNGVCDGSAAVLLPNDNLLVAYDEQNTLFEYSLRGGHPLQEHDYAIALNSNSEVDVEAAVAIDQHIWWIGSHGNDGSGEQALSRQQLFKTTVLVNTDSQITVEVEGESIDLLPVLLRQGISAGILDQSQKNKKPKKGGINIEGLSVLGNGNLLLGLRSPLTGGDTGDAILAQVDLSASQPTIVRFFILDLDNRGIRDIQAFENGYLLIAGDVDSGGDFSIYRWEVDAIPHRILDLPAHFNAEALVYTGKQWLVMSDDGKVKRHDESAKDGDRRCDSIRRKNPLAAQHASVFFRALVVDRQLLR